MRHWPTFLPQMVGRTGGISGMRGILGEPANYWLLLVSVAYCRHATRTHCTLERSGKQARAGPLPALSAGVLLRLMSDEGMTLPAGASFARINWLGKGWLDVAVLKRRSEPGRLGAKGRGQTACIPGESLEGIIEAIFTPGPTWISETVSGSSGVTHPQSTPCGPGMTADVDLSR